MSEGQWVNKGEGLSENDTHRPVSELGEWESNHPLEHKRSLVRTLQQRAESLTSEEEDKTKEEEHIKKVVKMNGYKPWIFNTIEP